MVYIPNPYDTSLPTDATSGETAQAEFRAIKQALLNSGQQGALFNIADTSPAIALSAGNYAATNVTAVAGFTRANAGKLTGKWFFEVFINTVIGVVSVGAAKLTTSNAVVLGSTAASFAYRSNGTSFTNNVSSIYGASYTAGDVIGFSVDCATGQVIFYKNGVSQGVAFTITFSGAAIYPCVGLSTATDSVIGNFGANSFAYPIPANYLPWAQPVILVASGAQNVVINGAMEVDQRNSGAVIAPAISGNYTVDRFAYLGSVAAKFNFQQNAGAVTPAPGYKSYAGFTVAASYVPGVGETFFLSHKIEGNYCRQFQFGLATAQSATLLFWVYSSVTGLHSGCLKNSASTRSFSFSYSIPAANTWTKIAINVTGDTSGTWLVTSGVGIEILWNLGSGANFLTVANQWNPTNATGAAGAVSVVSAGAGSTFFVTGVEFRRGIWAANTLPELCDYASEYLKCLRYFFRTFRNYTISIYAAGGGVLLCYNIPLKTPMRAAPTITASYGASVNISSNSSNITTEDVELTFGSAAAGMIDTSYLVGNTFTAEL